MSKANSEKILIIVESPNKVKTISGILKNAGYSKAVVMASVGEFDAISSYDFVLKGITPDYVDVEVLIASYLKLVNADQSTKVLYLQGKQIKDNKFYYCSYNSLAK